MSISGGSGLTTVTTDATLTGAGTPASTLKVAKPAKTIFVLVGDAGGVTTGKFMAISGSIGVLGEGFDTVELNVQTPMPVAGTFKNLYMNFSSNSQPACTVTMRKNGVNQTLLVTSVLNTASVISDTADSFTVVAGDLISYTVTIASGVFAGVMAVEFDF